MDKEKKITQGNKLFLCFEERIGQKRQTGKESTADLYRAVTNWLKQFTGGEGLEFGMITQLFVADFETFLESKGLKTNSVNTYLSNFRALYHSVANEYKKKIKDDPFANLKIKPQPTAKRALSRKVMEEIAGLKLEDKPELKVAADLSLFSFMACGMAFVDLVHLKAENIKEGEIIYNRQKTGTEIRIGITDGMKMILDKYRQEGTPYFFPLLKDENGSYEDYKLLLKCQNEALKEIGQFLVEPIVLTTYRFRHTWASEALLCNTPMAVISQALGHTSEKTTRFYLALLNQSVMNKANKLIIKSVENLLVEAV